MLIGAGLPKIYAMLSEAKSYSERLFIYKEIDSLDRDQSIEAIRKPAEKLNVSYTDEAVGEIIDITKGYPFFIQQLCQIVFQNTDGKRIDEKHVESCIPEFFHNLDNGFLRCATRDVRKRIRSLFLQWSHAINCHVRFQILRRLCIRRSVPFLRRERS